MDRIEEIRRKGFKISDNRGINNQDLEFLRGQRNIL